MFGASGQDSSFSGRPQAWAAQPWARAASRMQPFIQYRSLDVGQAVRLGPAPRPFQTFTSTAPRARFGLVPCGANVEKQNDTSDPLAQNCGRRKGRRRNQKREAAMEGRLIQVAKSAYQ